ncbi:hypothetical protein INS49_014363 [Diaporthe citri]|uniref:uncharacterized protein n=1 Tax=Diaporthe citri TaxID=83186 RepID=UPI001C82699D|nr:uncharacterized protein INS49_014363 [Diaporthe citri]KAG6358479.1 hypothetical protein INS49_014363 [Diaporthe citri]
MEIWMRYYRTGLDCLNANWTGSALRIGGGYQWSDVYAEAQAHNAIVVGGGAPSIGAIGGWLQGGGYGPATHQYGIGADQVLEAEVVRITTTAICGTDLHIYHGVLGSQEVPWTVGHEGMGIVVETGSAVTSIKEGDRVVISAVQAPGHLLLEPTIGGGAPIFGGGKDWGDLGGTLAEYVRVPIADETLMEVGNPQIPDRELLFLSDIFATGWEGLNYSGFQPGDDVAVFGAGPVGLMCAYSAKLRGASRVYSIDHVPSRLAKAKSIGAIPINFTKGGLPSEQILKLAPDGVTRVCDCVGESASTRSSSRTRPSCSPRPSRWRLTRAASASEKGGIGVPGVNIAQPDSKGTPRESTIAPDIKFPLSLFWGKSLSMRGGSADILTVASMLFELVTSGVARPGFVVSKEYIGLERAPEAFRRFDQHLETKVLFKLPWYDEHRQKRKSTGEEDTALGREHEASSRELDPHGSGRSTR